MQTLLTALRKSGLISGVQEKREMNRKEKIRIMDQQINRLYKNPSVENLIRIENLETALALFRR